MSGFFYIHFGKKIAQKQVNLTALIVVSAAHLGHFILVLFADQLGNEYLILLTAVTLLFTILLIGLTYRIALVYSIGVGILFYLVVFFNLDLEAGELVFQVVFMAFFLIAGLLAGYWVERSARQEFLQLESLQVQRKRLEDKNKELAQFAYIASHDLQEPLRTVSSFTQLLDEDYREELDEDGQAYLDFILKASGRMRNLIKGLLDYSRLGREKKIEKFNATELVDAVLKDLGVAIQEKEAKVTAGKLPVIKGYPTEFRLLIQNLISNALKFSHTDRPPEIRIEAKREKDHWQFSVKDNGIGIETAHLEKIFLIFQRLHSKKAYEGTGIGLAHCRKVVELHGGKIWAESTSGQGSTFYFTVQTEFNHAL